MRSRSIALLVWLLSVAAAVAAPAPATVVDGRAYVALARAAADLKARVEAAPDTTQARLRTGDHVVTLTRNWARVLVDGAPVVLDAPVRVRNGVWLVPATFVGRVAARLASPAETTAPPAAPAEIVALEELRVRSYPTFTRIVVETAVPLTYRTESGAAREVRVRLVGLAAEPRVEHIADGFIADARLERAGGDAILRVAFEGASGDLRLATFTDPPRVVLDFLRPDDGGRGRGGSGAPLRTIVIDAGHGGYDSGAVGAGGLMEKDVVLDVARRVTRLVESRLSLKVLLSRDADYFVPLRDRTSFANRERADLFVSIHANADREASSAGVETYFLSSEATDGGARQVAAAENAVVQLERPSAPVGGRRDIVKTILWDLAQSEYQMESSRLAEIVLDSMTQALRIPNRGVKQAGFYVLGGAAMPAVLIEVGFVTNPHEEKRLRDTRYRDEIARAIYAGLVEYKRQLDLRARAEVAPALAR